jgi:hypothetical protein
MTSILPAEIMFLNLAIFVYASLYTCYSIYSNFKDSQKYNEEEGSYYRYLTVFLIYYLVTSIITVGGGSLGKFALAGVEFIYLIVILFYMPYFLDMHNVSLIINQVVVLSFSALLILNDMANFLHPYRGYVMIGMEVLLVIVNGLGIVRLYVHTAYNQKAFEKAKADAEKAKLGPKEEFKLPEPEKSKKISNTLQKSIFERQQEQREKDLTALQKIKNRLKSEFKEKVDEERGSLMAG